MGKLIFLVVLVSIVSVGGYSLYTMIRSRLNPQLPVSTISSDVVPVNSVKSRYIEKTDVVSANQINEIEPVNTVRDYSSCVAYNKFYLCPSLPSFPQTITWRNKTYTVINRGE